MSDTPIWDSMAERYEAITRMEKEDAHEPNTVLQELWVGPSMERDKG